MRKTVLFTGLLVAGLVMLAQPTKAEAATNTSVPKTNPSKLKVEVAPGDSLSKIANKYQTTYVRLFNANKKIKDPDVIFPGEKIRIPHPAEKLPKRKLATVAVSQPVQAALVQAPAAVSSQPITATPAPVATPVASGSVWDRLAQCESGGNWAINTGNGYYGGLQFSQQTWQSVGGQGYPHQNSRAEQIKRGQILQARSGWGQWPACTSMLGLR